MLPEYGISARKHISLIHLESNSLLMELMIHSRFVLLGQHINKKRSMKHQKVARFFFACDEKCEI